MRTDDLINSLSRSPQAEVLNPRALSARFGLAVAVPAALFLLAFGVRPDLISQMANPLIAVKTLLPLTVMGFAWWAVTRLARPGRVLRLSWGWALVVPVVVTAAFGMLGRPADLWFAEARPFYLGECIGLIILLSVVPAIIGLRLASRGASVRPRLTATFVGLAAGAGAAAGYSLFCTQDNPMFYVPWYGLAICVVTLATVRWGTRRLLW